MFDAVETATRRTCDGNPNVSSRANPGPEDVKTPLSVKTPLEELASLMLP